ncbi:hypothetical protein Glove_326g71 [Diversispora epigaea]|uniref:Nudix hydrolase domain-containing protein n=1 Tax=Diversispora epigaea TaxID=1348612 RepID=A0A397HMD6_9GLOM|nr:hypothetical protein Glove_326g71 [Diversispora epigaea]
MYKYLHHHIFKSFSLKAFRDNNYLSKVHQNKYLFMANIHQFSFNIGEEVIPITTKLDIDVASVLEFQPFKEWTSTLSKEMLKVDKKELKIRNVEIQNVDYFGLKIGFVKFKVDAIFTETGKSAPGIIFMRGGSVAVLLILRSKERDSKIVKEHVVLTYQPRLAVPSLSFPEIPAGMLDGSGNFIGKASQEIKEETGIEVNDQNLIDMTALAYDENNDVNNEREGKKYQGAYPSPGGSDEFLRLCICIKEMNREDVEKLEGKLCGLRDHGEQITVGLIELKNLWKIPDMKALSALALYDALKRNDKI